MGATANAWARGAPPLGICATAVLNALADRCNEQRGVVVCWPSITRICIDTRWGPSAVRQALRELQDDNLVAVFITRSPNGKTTSSTYVLNVAGHRPESFPAAARTLADHWHQGLKQARAEYAATLPGFPQPNVQNQVQTHPGEGVTPPGEGLEPVHKKNTHIDRSGVDSSRTPGSPSSACRYGDGGRVVWQAHVPWRSQLTDLTGGYACDRCGAAGHRDELMPDNATLALDHPEDFTNYDWEAYQLAKTGGRYASS